MGFELTTCRSLIPIQPSLKQKGTRECLLLRGTDSNRRPPGYELQSETVNLFALGLAFQASPVILSSSQPGRIRLTRLYPQLCPVTRVSTNLCKPTSIIQISHSAPLSAGYIV